ncbi:hypothetical protein ACFFQF_02330 [Haladaptatus pallidirubidus]|uniref:Uncharacterized protein n=1 Tax=Haladaptatus pallidirubidus TaxID=1008152 RepID=A0AAV3UAV7_9EURY|nr:hypothetical protein [Haladaptatus pallidirubidus]
MNVRNVLAGRAVWGWYLLLVVPVVIGALDTRFMTPLALPGYLVLTLGSASGSHLFPTFELWVFWVPFFLGMYVVSVGLAAVYRAVRGTFVAFK